MMVVKGTHVALKRGDGSVLELPARYGMLHDPEGAVRKRCEVFFAPFSEVRREPPELSAAARRYLGDHYEVRLVRTDIPKSGWVDKGLVTTIWYRRNGNRGKYKANEDFVHPFRSPIPFVKKPVMLSKSGRVYRIDLGTGAVIDDRGFVFP